MKKIVMTAALAIASFGAFAVGTSTTANAPANVVVTVEPILSVSATPGAIGFGINSSNATSASGAQEIAYTVKSNAPYNMSGSMALSIAYTGASSGAGVATSTQREASVTAFKNALMIGSNASTMTPLSVIMPSGMAAAPVTYTTDNVATPVAGTPFIMRAQLNAVNHSVLPGTYTLTVTAIATQP
jgi:hypothetical protein